VFLFIPFYLIISYYGASTVTHQYWYVVSAAFENGAKPVICLGIMILMMNIIAIFLFNLLKKSCFMHAFNIGSTPKTIKNRDYFQEFKLFIIGLFKNVDEKVFTLEKNLLLLMFHVINIGFSIVISGLYINYVSVNRSSNDTLIIIWQIGISGLKVLWNTIYIPMTGRVLALYRMPHSRIMQNRLFMAIINFIVAPVLANAIANQSCFYYVFHKSPTIYSNVAIKVCYKYGKILV
jgi:uncharacterized membrane protein YagU involved in acid resistance